MNTAAEYVCSSFAEIFLAYGQSDEYSFVLNKNTTLFSRRTDKILSCIVSAFTSAYVFHWRKHFEQDLQDIPTFDSRIVQYPNEECLKDYFRWRQVDCHINNLYNTVFWEMVRTGKTHQEVEKILKDTNSGQKN
jgi:tRNA(His) guanylyltransferase